MTTPETPELLPCPFCGSDAEIKFHDDGVDIGCKTSSCAGYQCYFAYKDDDEAIKAWNTRPTPAAPETAEALEALDKIIGLFFTAPGLDCWYDPQEVAKECEKIIRTALQSAPRSVIKPLVFVQEEDLKTSYVASTPFGNEYITALDSGKFHYNNYDYETLAEAKAAAEAHWQAKIGECLE